MENTLPNDVQDSVVENQDVEPYENTEETGTGENEGVAAPQPSQSEDENAKYAAARRQAEAQARQAEEQARLLEEQNQRLLGALGAYGYEGSPDEIADMLMAQTRGISEEEARAIRQAEEARNAEVRKLQTERDSYKKFAIEKFKNDDLQKLKSTYPDDKEIQGIKAIEDLGQDFGSLLGALGDPILAYDALAVKKQRETKPTPKDIGATNESGSKEKDFYTPEEVDKLTDADYDKNPKLWDTVRKSMLKW